MNILITGGAGFIGSNLVNNLIQNNHTVTVLDNLSTGYIENFNPKASYIIGDLCLLSDESSYQYKKIVANGPYDFISHHAAHMNLRKSMENPSHDVKNNVLGTLDLLNCIIKNNLTKSIIFASSGGAIYGDYLNQPYTEIDPCQPISIYGISKLACENYIKNYCNLFNINYIFLRYTNVYGSLQRLKSEAGIVAIILNNYLNRSESSIYGDGTQIRDYIHINDVVEINNRIINGSIPLNSIYNVSTNIETSVLQIISKLENIINDKILYKLENSKIGDAKYNCCNNSKISKYLSNYKFIQLDDGLDITYKWLLDDYSKNKIT